MRKNNKGKKNRNNYANVPPVTNGNHRQPGSQPMVNSPPTAQDSPRYAGPTFHASPAPSALPMPTFFSKSVPEADFPQSGETEDESQESQDEPGQYTPSKAKSGPLKQGEVGNPSPLDFLFKAARDARTVTGASDDLGRGSPAPLRIQSSPAFQPVSQPVSQLADGVPGAMFPFELENSETKTMPIGPSFATPFKERMGALRSSSSPSPAPDDRTVEEDQLKAKSNALKDLLLNGRSQGPLFQSSASTPRPGKYSPTRHASGPPTQMPTPSSNQRSPTKPADGGSGKDSVPHQYLAALCSSAKSHRTASSGLRKELSPTSPISPPRSPLERNQHVYPRLPHSDFSGNAGNYVSPTPTRMVSGPSPARDVPVKTDPADMRRMEDDLRRILKLDANDGHSPRGVGHRIA